MVANYHKIMFSLKSSITQKLFLFFLINKDKEIYLNELARTIEVDPKNLDRKLKQLELGGIFKSEFKGKQRYYSLNKSCPLLNEYLKIVNETIGLPQQLKKNLNKVNLIEEAYIFGSYASNKFDMLSDIDLLIIGNHKLLDAEKAILPIQKVVEREINIVDMTKEEFERKKRENDPLIIDLLAKPMIKVI